MPSGLTGDAPGPVVPLFTTDRRDRASLVGSACALRFGSTSYLVTAGHVLERLPREGLATFWQGEPVQIQGEMTGTTSGVVDGRVTADFDFAVIRLSGEYDTAFRAFELADMDVSAPPSSFQALTFIGWPASRFKPRVSLRKLNAEQHRISVGACAENEYTRFGLRPEVHILAEFRRKMFVDRSGQPASLADLHGMSGGGIVGHRVRAEEDSTAALVGITVGFKGRDEYLCGMRMNMCLALICKMDPNAELDLDHLASGDPVFRALVDSRVV